MTTRLLDSEGFMAHRETLDHPDEAAVRDAFARLPKRGCIEVRCRWERRLEMQRSLADLGAFAICLRPLAEFQEVLITALKGKVGACFETGRNATYTGAALAVMDDDHHLVVGAIRVCEKTGGIYTLPPYQGLLTVTDGDQGMIRRLETDPLPFDCNTFEQDADRLATRAFAHALPGEPLSAVFYPGPFRLLVLQDGSILRRGNCAKIPTRFVKDLELKDGLLMAPPHRAAATERSPDYPATYRNMGAGCLLDETRFTDARPATVASVGHDAPLTEQALTALRTSSEETRQRLRRLITGREPYFILTGSDPMDAMGCCPSTQVGEANRLVEAGLLACYRIPAPSDACTTTIYAFIKEILVRDGRPEFFVNTSARRQAAVVLERTARRLRIDRTALKATLILLAASSLFLAGRRAMLAFGHAPTGFEVAMAKSLDVRADDSRLFVCLFHGQENCAACEAMGRLCRRTIETDFAPQARAGLVAFREVSYDAPGNRAIKNRLDLYSSMIGLVRYVHGKPQGIRMLTQDTWDLWQDDAAFMRVLLKNIQGMLPEDLPVR